jgi:hypothetical protein
MNDRVIVQDEHILASRLADAEIVVPGESLALSRCKGAYLRKSLPYDLQAGISGAIVHQDDFERLAGWKAID